MTRHLILAALLLSLPALTDYLVDRQFQPEPVGYTHSERDAMSRLVERSVQPAYAWRTHAAARVADLWGITPQELDGPVNIWGEKPANHKKGRQHG